MHSIPLAISLMTLILLSSGCGNEDPCSDITEGSISTEPSAQLQISDRLRSNKELFVKVSDEVVTKIKVVQVREIKI